MPKIVSRVKARVQELANDGWATSGFSTALRRAVGPADALPAGRLPKPDAYRLEPTDAAVTVAQIALSRANVLAEWLDLWIELDDRSWRLDVVRIDDAGRRHLIPDHDFVAGYHASCRGLDTRAAALAGAAQSSVEADTAALLLALPARRELEALLRSGELEQVELGGGHATRVATSSIERSIVRDLRARPKEWRLHGERMRRFAHFAAARDLASGLAELHPDRKLVNRERLASIGIHETAWASTQLSAALSSGRAVATTELERALLVAERASADLDYDVDDDADDTRPAHALYRWAYVATDPGLTLAEWCGIEQ